MKIPEPLILLSALVSRTVDAWACGTCLNNSTEPIIPVPAPWVLTATVFAFPLILPTVLPVKAYSPLERGSTATEGEFLGLVGVIMIIRYSDTPVGPYDELVIVPGFFGYNRTNVDGSIEARQNIRGSRFYVSQKYTNYNGRINWNIPKHLAKFDWTSTLDGSTSVKIYPFDATPFPNDAESAPSLLPFFQMKFTPSLPFLPIPLSTDLFTYLGISQPMLGQPPLPAGNGSYHELPGTKTWAETLLGVLSEEFTAGVFDMDQGTGDNTGDGFNAVGDEFYPNFWPGLGRFNVGAMLENATVTFPVAYNWV